jgi:hypothetical protein
MAMDGENKAHQVIGRQIVFFLGLLITSAFGGILWHIRGGLLNESSILNK